MATKEFGVDVSRYQGNIDWKKMKQAGVLYAGIRTSISWAYIDNMAEKNIKDAMNEGIYVLPYWVYYPNQDAERQVDNFMNALTSYGIDIKKIITVPDVELGTGLHACAPKTFQTGLSNALTYTKRLTGVSPIIYSRAGFIDAYITGTVLFWNASAPSWLDSYDWWLAQYLTSGVEHPGLPKLPKGVSRERVVIHQTTDSGYNLGAIESKVLDYDRWQLDTSVSAYFDKIYKPTVVKPVEPVIIPEPVVETETVVTLGDKVRDILARLKIIERKIDITRE